MPINAIWEGSQIAVLLALDTPMADAFCSLRLAERGMAFDASNAEIGTRAVIERATPR